MDTNTSMMLWMLGGMAVLALGLAVWALLKKDRPAAPVPTAPAHVPQVLQAHERILLLIDRMALPNLLQKLSVEGLGAVELQFLLVKTIREEFDYNVTQQLYLAPDTWKAVQTLKEQNLQWIRQVSAQLPAEASASDLHKALLLAYYAKGDKPLHEWVAAAVAHDAQMLLKA